MTIIDVEFETRETSDSQLLGADLNAIEDVALDTAPNSSDVGLLTAVARALNDVAEDELLTRDTVFANLDHGQDTVSSPGTEEALNGGTTLSVPAGAYLKVIALPGNAGTVFVGDGDVGTGNGAPLEAGKGMALAVDDVASVSIDVQSGNGGDGVGWIVEQA